MEFWDSWTRIHDSRHRLGHLKKIWDMYESLDGGNYNSTGLLTTESFMEAISSPPEVIDEEFVYRHPSWMMGLLIVAYLLVFCFGLLGNFSVLIVVVRTPRMSTVTNFFICNLAVADLLVVIFCMIPNLLSSIFVPWTLGWLLCKVVPYIQGVAVCASIYSLVAISVERCLAIQWPLHSQLTKSTARLVIVGIWIWASLVAVPWAIVFEISAADKDHPDISFCVEVWPKGYEYFETYYFLFANVILCYLFPLGLISLCYFIIWLRVWRRALPCDSHNQSSSIELIHQKAKAGVLKTLIFVVLLFAFSWLPLYLIFTRLKLFQGELTPVETGVITFGLPIAQWLGSSNSMWNSWIYAFLNVKFRRAFKILFCGKKQRRDPVPIQSYPKPNVHIILKRLNAYKGTNTSLYNVTEV